MSDKKKYTYGDLLTALLSYGPEQLAHQVKWCGEERGGTVDGITVSKHRYINPNGDGIETEEEVFRFLTQDEHYNDATAREEVDGESTSVAKGQPVLCVDGEFEL